MSKKSFQQGLILYKNGDLQQALEQFNKAIDNGSQDNYMMLDTRAAVYAKLGETKKALKDARKTIEVAPDQWQGYSRAAQLFLAVNKPEACLTMVRLGLNKLKEEHTDRRASLLSLEAQALKLQENAERRRQKHIDHMAKLPIELFGEIARMTIADNHTAVIRLSQVSKHWRQVTHNCHYLWNTLVLDRRRPKHKAKTWIERAKGKIYELSVHKDVFDDRSWPYDILKDVRWEDLRILKCYYWKIDDYLFRIGMPNSLHNLESLDLDGTSYTGPIMFPTAKMPNLQSIALRSNHRFLPIFHGPLVQKFLSITLQNIGRPADAVLNEFFETQTLLQSLALYDVHFPVIVKNPMKYLTCLDIKKFSQSLLLSELPALQILRLEAVGMINHLLGVVEKSRPNLTELTIRSCVIDPLRITSILLVSPNLQILEVSNTQAAQIIEFLLTPSPASDTNAETPVFSLRCPRLTQVNFSKCIDVQTGPIVRLIRARLPDPSNPVEAQIQPITSLIINECHNIEAVWLPWMREKVQSVSCIYMTKKAKFRGA